MAPAQAILRFEAASFAYGRRAVLRDVSFDVEAGSFVGIVGPNGSGKTTLLRAALGVLEPSRGRVSRLAPNVRVGYVPQRLSIDPVFPLRVFDLVLMGRYPRIGPLRRAKAEDLEAVDEACVQLGILHLKHELFRDLSGGQQQRSLIARALAAQPDLLVLDEPTNGMDIGSERGIMDVVTALCRDRNVTILFVTHLLNLVAGAATHIALVHDGAVTIGPRDEILLPPRLSEIYGVPIDVHEVGGRRLVIAREPAR